MRHIVCLLRRVATVLSTKPGNLTVRAHYTPFISCFLMLIVLFSGQQFAHAQTAEELVARLRARYDSVELLKADFTQRTTSPFGEELPLNSGTLILEGNNYRVETDAQTFVTNGATTWVYDSFQNQVIINDFVEDEATFVISDFLTSFHEEYQITESSTSYLNGIKHYILRLSTLTPSSFFKEVTLQVRDSDDVITEMNVLDVNDARLQFNLEDVELNPEIDGDPFDFEPPTGADVIDLRSE